MIRSPFIHHEGRWYVVFDFEKGVSPDQELRLRPLTPEETKVLERYLDDTLNEAWAVIRGGGR